MEIFYLGGKIGGWGDWVGSEGKFVVLLVLVGSHIGWVWHWGDGPGKMESPSEDKSVPR